MNATASVSLRQFAARAWDRSRQESAALGFIALHPRELAKVPRWLRERNAATMALRAPWWPYDAVAWVVSVLSPEPQVFEYGGGGSTLWLEDRGAMVTVAEHDEAWHAQLADQVAAGTTVLFRPPSASGTVTSAAAAGYFDNYVATIDGRPDESLDLVIVDGRARVECVRHAMPKVRPGGLLLLDDADRARYRPAIKMLADWERHVFAGLKPGARSPAQTWAWKRPVGN
jgi:hypothetical protein